jgi:hypothetical protein
MIPLATRFRHLAPLVNVALLFVSAGFACGGENIIAQYTFPTATATPSERTGPGFEPTTIADDAVATDLSLSPNLPSPAEAFIADRDPAYGRPVLRIDPGDMSSSPAQAVAGDRYFEFTVAAEVDFFLNLTSLTFSAARGGGATPRGWALRSSVDGFASNIDSQAIPTQRPDLTPFTIDLSGDEFQALDAVTFRIYTFVPSGGQSVEYVDVTLNGSVE